MRALRAGKAAQPRPPSEGAAPRRRADRRGGPIGAPPLSPPEEENGARWGQRINADHNGTGNHAGQGWGAYSTISAPPSTSQTGGFALRELLWVGQACTGTETLAYTGAMQSFTVPACATEIAVDAYGAEGGTSTGQSGGMNIAGGLGARALGTFVVAGGQTLDVLVGGRGSDSSCGSGGGGGSFVVSAGNILLIAGGGGGGFHCNVLGSAIGGGGSDVPDGGGGSCTTAPGYVRPPAAGGTNGSGGTSAYGGGGGGFLGAGTGNPAATGGGLYPGSGGVPSGGFGGGGGNYAGCCGGSGAGGGYSGGSGGLSDGCAGGGGGSINNGSNQTVTASVRPGDGTVTISW